MELPAWRVLNGTGEPVDSGIAEVCGRVVPSEQILQAGGLVGVLSAPTACPWSRLLVSAVLQRGAGGQGRVTAGKELCGAPGVRSHRVSRRAGTNGPLPARPYAAWADLMAERATHRRHPEVRLPWCLGSTVSGRCGGPGRGLADNEKVSMGLRDRRRGDSGPAGRRYRMQEKLVSIGDDYWIEDETGQRSRSTGRPYGSATRSCSRTRQAVRSRRSKNTS